jgi:hypothetical protein
MTACPVSRWHGGPRLWGVGTHPLLYGTRAQRPNQEGKNLDANVTQCHRGLALCYDVLGNAPDRAGGLRLGAPHPMGERLIAVPCAGAASDARVHGGGGVVGGL